MLSTTPLHQLSLELGAGDSTLTGPFAFAELEAHPWSRVGMYLKGETRPGETSVVAGLKATWDFM